MNEPLTLFESWYADAQSRYADQTERDVLINAVSLATVDERQRPSVRMVLFKGLSNGEWLFFTNYNSPKAMHLARHGFAALAFHWPLLQRQVRVEGRVEKCSVAESQAYFQTRPRESQLGAWASNQSCEIRDRATLERQYAEAEKRFAGKPVPCPPHWGGYRLIPDRLEFWQGRSGRLHERTLYVLEADGWRRRLLSP